MGTKSVCNMSCGAMLELIGTVTVPATTGKFVANTKFKVDTGPNAQVKISYVGNNFKEWFLNGVGKTENPISERTLRYHELRQPSVDDPIIAELGSKAKAETTLSEMFSLMEKQGKGEDGVLLNNGQASIFYIRDVNDVLRTVYVYCYGDGWRVVAYPVEDPDGWHEGRRVFSRNSG